MIEILKVETELQNPVDLGTALISETIVTVGISKGTPSARERKNDPNLIYSHAKSTHLDYAEATESGGGATSQDMMHTEDFAQGGRGFLIATDNIRLWIISSGESATNTVYGRILYRIVKVSAEELIGLVSQ